MKQAELDARRLFRDDFTVYARQCLKIRSKSGMLLPLDLNEPQIILHSKMEEQRKATGKVRAIIVKARQQGSSTYVAARYFHQVTHRRGAQAFILTHEQQATNNLFEMVDRYYENLPRGLQPHLGASNSKEVSFDRIDSGYKVGTAGTKGVGRSSTIQYFHGSEVAFWPNAETHVDGVLQAVPTTDDTEVVLESTANGIGGFFWRTAQAALRGESEFILIFLPWFVSGEYRRGVGGASRNKDAYGAEWTEYADLFKLSRAQLEWAYRKNAEMCMSIGAEPRSGPCWKFRQEYPATVSEAFQSGGDETFIRSEHVLLARRAAVKGEGPIILGVDPERGGGDKTAVVDRQGRAMGFNVYHRWDIPDTMIIASRVADVIRDLARRGTPPVAVNVDTTGVGAGVYDRLVEYGYGGVVRSVQFGGRAQNNERCVNRRTEMWDRMREWISQPDEIAVSIPDDDILHGDLTSAHWGPGATRFVGERLMLEEKTHIRERLGLSPDMGDAAALTFAFPPSTLPSARALVTARESYDPLEV